MKCKKYFIATLLSIGLNFIPIFIPSALSQTDPEYGSLIGIIPIITIYKVKPPLYLLPKGTIPVTAAPAIPNPTGPVAITTTPSAPGKYPLVRWLLPGGPPPTQTPILPPLTCNYDDC